MVLTRLSCLMHLLYGALIPAAPPWGPGPSMAPSPRAKHPKADAMDGGSRLMGVRVRGIHINLTVKKQENEPSLWGRKEEGSLVVRLLFVMSNERLDVRGDSARKPVIQDRGDE